ncbi:MAG: hypothetical protein ACFE8V_11000 [Promethearchaeota archaeon]
MPYIIGTIWYPTHMQGEAAKTWLKIRDKYPPDETLFENLGTPVKTTEKGAKLMTIWLIKEGKFEKALNRISKFYFEFGNVEGLEYSIDVWMTFEEAVGLAGIE